jgi:hypothetical protein
MHDCHKDHDKRQNAAGDQDNTSDDHQPGRSLLQPEDPRGAMPVRSMIRPGRNTSDTPTKKVA